MEGRGLTVMGPLHPPDTAKNTHGMTNELIRHLKTHVEGGGGNRNPTRLADTNCRPQTQILHCKELSLTCNLEKEGGGKTSLFHKGGTFGPNPRSFP